MEGHILLRALQATRLLTQKRKSLCHQEGIFMCFSLVILGILHL